MMGSLRQNFVKCHFFVNEESNNTVDIMEASYSLKNSICSKLI